MKIIKLLSFLLLLPFVTMAKDYNASLFSIYSDGVTNNTGSIQKAIDYINENGGGRLVFYVGRYLTGTVRLKSNVTIKLEEGAVLVGAPSIYEYNTDAKKAIIIADGQGNIGISGKGVIEGNGAAINHNIQMLTHNKYVSASIEKPALIAFTNCQNILIDSVNLWQNANASLVFTNCSKISVDVVNIDGKNVPGNTGIVLENTTDAIIKNSFLNIQNNYLIKTGSNKGLQIINTITPTGESIGK
ncbi:MULTISPECIES: glycosyl hydrolase family 28 protein [Chitinophagaceae]